MSLQNYVFYWTSTGNSLALARRLADDLGGAVLVNMAEYQNRAFTAEEADTAAFVFPVHAWGSPIMVNRFLDNLKMDKPRYAFALIHSAGTPGDSYHIFSQYLGKNGLTCDAAFEMLMPSNYLIFHNPPVGQELADILASADERYADILRAVQNRESVFPPSDEARKKLSLTYPEYLAHAQDMAADFFTNEKCVGCGICAEACPTDNIEQDEEGKPVWRRDKCTHCLICLHWCPFAAIELTEKTRPLNRYHHPDITINDIYLNNGG